MRNASVRRSTARFAGRDMQFPGQSPQTVQRQKFFQRRLHYSCKRRLGILLSQPRVEFGL